MSAHASLSTSTDEVRPDPRAVRTRAAMIDAAVRLLRTGGVEGVTHQSVAAEAGVGRATVYRHWPRLTDLLLDALGESRPIVEFGEGDVGTRLVREFAQRLPQVNSIVTGALVGVLVGRGDFDDEVHRLRLHIFGGVLDAVRQVIDEGREDGQLLAEVPAERLGALMLGGLLFERTLLGRQLGPDDVEAIVDSVLRGWHSGPAGPRRS